MRSCRGQWVKTLWWMKFGRWRVMRRPSSGRSFDVTTCRFFWYYLRWWWHIEGYGVEERWLVIPPSQLHGPIPRRGGVEVWEVKGDEKAFKRKVFRCDDVPYFLVLFALMVAYRRIRLRRAMAGHSAVTVAWSYTSARWGWSFGRWGVMGRQWRGGLSMWRRAVFFCIICVDGGISKDTTSKSDGWSFRCHSCMVVYLGEVGLKFWEVGGDGKAFRLNYFDVMMCRFFCYYLRRWWEITGYGRRLRRCPAKCNARDGSTMSLWVRMCGMVVLDGRADVVEE